MLDDAEVEARIEGYYAPYHRAIGEAIDAAVAAGKPPVVLAIHSFTQAWKSVPRPWHVAVLWDKDPRSLARCCTSLRRSQASPSATTCPMASRDTLYQHGNAARPCARVDRSPPGSHSRPEGQEDGGATGFGGADGARRRRSRTQLHVIEATAPIPTARRRALDKLDKNYPRVAL